MQQWNAQINIPSVADMNHKQTHVYGKNIVRQDIKQTPPTIQAVQKQNTSVELEPKALPLKWLTDESV